ncbi:uncharacterized protein LOC116030808 [Ipomoea triloba]|uniref:uncharacterized protein LOC116030808 n=1 Tax=Ipomoea triloba TaxID=35885 RepID=UPI00125D0AB5|nr:uncharacterized protein LOC116030808 [Ipomoea triloba]
MASSAAPNLHANFGLPVCLSGITHPLPLPLPEEMADHDRRRKAMKTSAAFESKDTSWRSSSAADDQERGNQTSPGDADFASVLRDLASISLGHTAKAA